ncbi:MAG: M56 family metallopeptidase [Rhodothermales bacterium]
MQISTMISDLESLVDVVTSHSGILFPLLLKSIVILAFVGGVSMLLRSASATVRYRVLFSGVAAVLLLPLLTLILPAWRVELLPATEVTHPADTESLWSASGETETPEVSASSAPAPVPSPLSAKARSSDDVLPSTPNASAPAGSIVADAVDTIAQAVRKFDPLSVSATQWLFLVWMVGAVLALMRVAISHLGVSRLVRRSRIVDEDDWQLELEDLQNQMGVTDRIALRWSDLSIVPLNAGIRRSIILLPESASEWSADKRRAVLLHELAHVKRRDCLTHFLTQLSCALYWPNPFVWHVASRMVTERERAADDAVLLAGTRASSYAKTLLDTAQSYMNVNWTTPATLAMARKTQLENRMLAILNPKQERGQGTAANRYVASALVALIAVPLAAFSPARAQTTEPGRQSRYTVHVDPVDVQVPPVVVDIPEINVQEPDVDFAIPPIDIDIPEFTVEIPDFDFAAGSIGVSIPDIDIDMSDLESGFASVGEALSTFAVSVNGRSFQRDGRPLVVGDSLTIEQIIRLRKYGVDGDFIRGLKELGYEKPSYDDLVSLARHGAGPDYVRGMTSAGFGGLDLERYAKAARYGLDADYAREMQKAGLGTLSMDDLLGLARYGTSPELVRELSALGLSDLDAEGIQRLSRYGVDPEYISRLREMGFRDVSVSEIASLARYGVDADFIAAVRAAGYKNATTEELTKMSRYGLDAELLASIQSNGYKNITIDDAISMARYGVDGEYIEALSQSGYTNLPAEDIVRLRKYGVESSFVRDLKDAGVRKLSVDELVDMARHGIDADFIKSLRDN